ncbi:Thioredoxin, partial [Oryctes borbonicus]
MACGKVTFSTIFVLLSITLIATGQKSSLIILDENNWTQILEGEWMVEFYAPWCPACKGLEPVWKEFSTWADDLEIKVAQVDVTTSPGLSGRFMVTALPTIFHVINGQFRQYKATRDKDSFISFIEDKKWQIVEPISSWKSPASFQMSVVSYFFRLSQILRHIHNQLMEDFGLPTWGSYLIFAIATIILGALLGLILVCCIDLIYPPKYSSVKKSDDKAKQEKRTDKHSGDELADEDIKDDLIDLQDDQKSEPENKDDEAPRSNTSSPTIKKRKP